MRINLVLFRNARAPQNEKQVPFKEQYPLKLANRIDRPARDTLEGKCLFEMSLLLGCWKKNEFNESLCAAFAKKLKECYKNLGETMEKQTQLRKRDIPTPGTKVLTNKQLNYLLRQYPTV